MITIDNMIYDILRQAGGNKHIQVILAWMLWWFMRGIYMINQEEDISILKFLTWVFLWWFLSWLLAWIAGLDRELKNAWFHIAVGAIIWFFYEDWYKMIKKLYTSLSNKYLK